MVDLNPVSVPFQ